jgi:cyanate lyase
MKTAPTQTPSSCKANAVLTKEQMTDRIITAKVKKQLT